MARQVFFSFHYKRDVRRVVQIRNSWIVRPNSTAQPFYDKADWESIKLKPKGVENWIEKQLEGASVTVVLIGSETYDRKWVRHEIKRSYKLGKGILGIYIHNVKDPQIGTDIKGKNPLDYWTITQNDQKIPLSSLYKTYDWNIHDGYKNLNSWIEAAAKAAGR